MMLMAILLVMLVMVLNSACQGIVIQIIIAEIVSYNLSHLLFPTSCIFSISFSVFVSIDINDCSSGPCHNGGNCMVRIIV